MKTLIAVLFLTTLAVPAAAQPCAPRDQVVKLLADRYGETRRGIGLSGEDAVMEVFASAATGTWTITVSDPRGTTCMIASGEGFEALDEALVAGDPA